MKFLTTVKKIVFALFCAVVSNIAFADVEHAYVVRAKESLVYERCNDDKQDYAKAFEGIDVRVDGDETEDGVFGMPAYMVIELNHKYHLLIINNTHGVISVHSARKKGNQWICGKGEGRQIYLPELYEKLKAMGLKVLTVEELSTIHLLGNNEQK